MKKLLLFDKTNQSNYSHNYDYERKLMKRIYFFIIHSALMSLPISSYAQIDDIFNVFKKIAENSSKTGSDESSTIAVEINAFITKMNKSGGTNELRNTPDGELERIQELIPKRLGPLGEQVQRAGGEARNRLGNEYQQLNILKAEIGNEIQRRFKEARAQDERNVSEAMEALTRAREAEDEGRRIRAAEEARIQQESLKKQNSTLIAQSIPKAQAFAKEAGSAWKLFQKKDELTGEVEKFSRLETQAEGGEKVVSDITCFGKGVVLMKTSVYGALFPATKDRYTSTWGVDGRIALNDKVFDYTFSRSPQFNNVILVFFSFDEASGLFAFDQGNVFYRVVMEITSSSGKIVLKLPPLADSIKAVTSSCK